ncbi:hypothetical protein Mgra_00007269 [Meloidogyne graminicola]|uniref:Uncharacterized protein n=1 Tax=Meloidogyne graminicola TaxID=189291 RepID=A0A8S9ZJD4_9BILA|nr:hypothetical protein Mgra_00007269 [Meloidogyne graminicola]
MTKCGNIYYNYIKQCALANMFEDKKPDAVPKDNLQKKMLVLLDVCASCSNGGMITGIKLTHYEDPFGSIFGGCSEEKKFEDFSISGLSIKLNNGNKVNGNTSSFSIPVILYHRICESIFSKSVASDKYIDMKLHIQYICGVSSATKIINLPSIDVTKHKDRVAELRGIWINLDDGNFKQYLFKNNIYTENNKLNDWSNANIKCWTNNKEICNLN